MLFKRKPLYFSQYIKTWRLIALTTAIILFSGSAKTNSEIIEKSIISLKEIKTASYTLANQERINNELLTGKQFIKWSASPLKCYLYFIEPCKGAELIFCEGENNNKAIYNPNGFPYISISLDPLGDIMRKNNHHTLYETGFSAFISILKEINSNPLYKLTNLGNDVKNGLQCLVVESVNDKFGYTSHILTEKESIRLFGKKHTISEYLVSTKNSIDALKELNNGEVILVPNSYAKRIKLWIDKQNSVPICLEFYDEIGLFERYEIYDLTINPSFSETDFSDEIFGQNTYY
jgi:outer membrane lipoprotein-sorting protein